MASAVVTVIATTTAMAVTFAGELPHQLPPTSIAPGVFMPAVSCGHPDATTGTDIAAIVAFNS